jgi:CheY-like chemotaxis protein
MEVLRGNEFPKVNWSAPLDLNMARMNGIELLRALRADPALRATCVVVLTTSNDNHDKIDAYDLNVAGYLTKPVANRSFVDLMVTLNRYWTLVELP